ncbi:MAG: SDR family NAD(P)-dependent oxidoreductase [Firmicutes bacterium]|nr:SDR family NAD(P)-dependent oxidoreductase [Alicyclobacillaceae bacterium]MCL6497524.1 SDR family NAD(P)-dependent oxidoreductase [Bacillota bacterium]
MAEDLTVVWESAAQGAVTVPPLPVQDRDDLLTLRPDEMEQLTQYLCATGRNIGRLPPKPVWWVVTQAPRGALSRLVVRCWIGLCRSWAFEWGWEGRALNALVPPADGGLGPWLGLLQGLPPGVTTGQVLGASLGLPEPRSLLAPPRPVRTVLVTGAARGQGRAHAYYWAERGSHLILVDRARPLATVPYPLASEADLAATADGVRARGGTVEVVTLDARERAHLEQALAASRAAREGIDLVIANAGVFVFGSYRQLSWAQWYDAVSINLMGPWTTLAAARPYLPAGSRAVIIGSTAGLRGIAHLGAYALAKHGAVALALALSQELEAAGIGVAWLSPTGVDTPLLGNQAAYDLFAGGAGGTRQHLLDGLQAQHLLPRALLDPAEVAGATGALVAEVPPLTGVGIAVDLGFVHG